MLSGPEHYLPAETVTEKEGRASSEMFEDSVDIRGQLYVLLYEDGPPRTTAMSSQIKSDRPVAGFCKISSHVNITSGMFAETMHYDHGANRLRCRFPLTAKKRQAVHRRRLFLSNNQ